MQKYIEEIKNNYFQNYTAKIEQFKDNMKLTWSDDNTKPDYDITYKFTDNCIHINSIMGDIKIKTDIKANLKTINQYSLGQFAKDIIYRNDKKEFDPETAVKTIDNYIAENPGINESTGKFLCVMKYTAKTCSSLNNWTNQVHKIKKDYGLSSSEYPWIEESGDKYYNKTILYWVGLKLACK